MASSDLTSELVEYLRRNLDREYGIRLFNLSSLIYAARVPLPHIKEFGSTDSERIIGYMRTHIPKSELNDVAHAYVVADTDYVEVDPEKLFLDIYGVTESARASDSSEMGKEVEESKEAEEVGTAETIGADKEIEEVEEIKKTGDVKAIGADKKAEADEVAEKVETAEIDVEVIGAIEIADVESVFKGIESVIELEEQKEAEKLRKKSAEDDAEEIEETDDCNDENLHREIPIEAAEGAIHQILDNFARKKHKKMAIGKLSSGRRSEVLTQGKRGRYVRYRMPVGKPNDVAIAPTIRAAAMHADGGEFAIRESDVRDKVRRRRVATQICVVFDASGSMDDLRKTSVTKNVVLALLRDAYQRRDRVALITYAGRSAETVLPFTSSVELARRYIEHIPFGSTTPLAAGLKLGMDVLQTENKKEPSAIPILVLITDGTANMPLAVGGNIRREISGVGRLLKQNAKVLVIDISEEGSDLAESISRMCDGRYYHPSRMSQQTVYHAIKDQQDLVCLPVV
ncbi:MAG: VWA domain-containing protein [Euryarchaeota archaeon]|nr:VWA domain-containing protein [Euryarchaeota archaeon]